MKAAFFVLIFLIAAAVAEAAGMGAAPAELNFNIEKGKKQQREITVYNLGDEQLEFGAESSAEFLNFYHDRMLEGESEARIMVEADTAKLREGKHEAAIYITTVGKKTGVALSVGTAVKATVNVFSPNRASFIVGIFTSLAVAAAGLLLYFASVKAIGILRAVKAKQI